MWRKWAPRGYRILRISHILHANSRRQASGFPWLPQTPRELPGKPAAVIADGYPAGIRG